ncbi:hypothetical protein ESY86_05715 [Subsaximicrobium wynnwilliamsii]|uniref:Tetratricopeptide repeat protein n=1 Tax=Subsaximicrobium wynnwilliamsii TaxID=291179 RepID=A0A5C6ZJ90_9FLAO|nr:hypothetical protein [Subsaximicrobium wynnwilliamsii]TXD84552.1 hypothetical protein ESY87_05490 [Subsaximicrobium wynnwilliamsii]TXD90234.1 hypothetical protein ESY86_05715 [Subsaximicrobium wynnwilliamsii]TXE04285.1 hypothetical protein ESY88_05485 [Subsaximicrobium wynnwilliamsii]
MNKEQFTYLLQQPQHISVDQTTALHQLLATYPFVQSARALYLKGLMAKGSPQYNQELKVTAAYTTDRSVLFDYITSEVFNQNEISQRIKQNSEQLRDIEVNAHDDITVAKKVTIDDALKQQIANTEGVLDPELFEKKAGNIPESLASQKQSPQPTASKISDNNSPDAPEKTLKMGQPLEFDQNETHSFAEWLNITGFKPIERKAEELSSEESEPSTSEKEEVKDDEIPQKNSAAIDEKFKLIDKFLKNNPKIVPSKESPKIELVKNDHTSNDGLMTETLARIYLEQNNYEKAIQSYKVLSLKYPEKSGFFADQIKAVKQLQEHNPKNQ